MRTNKFLAAVLLVGAAFSALTSCQKDGPQPNYQSMEGVNAITGEEAVGLMGSWKAKKSVIFFYSDIFPILSLEGSTLTLHSNPSNSLLFYFFEEDSTSQTSLLPYKGDTALDSLNNNPALWNIPNCDYRKGTFFGFSYKLPDSDCVVDFYLEIANPAKGLYYRTANYRYVISTPSTSNDFFNVTLTKL